MLAALRLARGLGEELKGAGTYHPIERAIPHAELNRLMRM